MPDIFVTAVTGLDNAAATAAASAARVARGGAGLDLAAEAATQISARAEFRADAEVLAASDEMTKSLLDLKV